MAFDFDSFCKECYGLSKSEILQKMHEKINDLKAITNSKKKPSQISQEISVDKSDIKTLERMASYISGKSLLRVKFTANELKLVDKILERMH